MHTRPLIKQDYDHIVQVIDRWWGGPTSALAHPLFFYELGQCARVVEHEATLVGFLFGFVAPGPPKVGYVHLVGIHPDFRRRGVGKVLYQAFEEDCGAQGAVGLKAVTATGNEASMAFHQAMGWRFGHVENYAGPGRARVVFEKTLAPPGDGSRSKPPEL
jgi:GNAT superfamily N-acetyltransferase